MFFPWKVRYGVVGWLAIAATGCTLFPEKDNTTFRTPIRRIEALEQLAADSKQKNSAQRQEVITTLAGQFQTEEDPLIREHLLRTLAKYPDPRTFAVMRSALDDPSTDVQVFAIEEIAKQGGPDAVSILCEAVQNGSEIDVRLAATRGLANYKDKEVFPALNAALDDTDPALQHRAVESLRVVTGKDFGGDISAWREYVKTGAPPAQKEQSIAEQFRNALRF